MELDRTRRRVLGAAGGLAAAVGLAGCAGGQSAPASPSDAPSDTETADRTDEATDDGPDESGTRTVFHFSGMPDEQGHAVANVRNLLGDETVETADIALVTNGPGIQLLTDGGTNYRDAAPELAAQGVSLLVCSNSMDALGVEESDLLPSAESVPSGVGTLSRLQAEGYGYIKTP